MFPESPLVEVFEREVRRTVHHECEYDAEFTWRGRMESAARDVPGLNSRTLEEAGAEICATVDMRLPGPSKPWKRCDIRRCVQRTVSYPYRIAKAVRLYPRVLYMESMR